MVRDAVPEEEPVPDPRLISVVIPCHDHARFLASALESVLGQDDPSFEVVVVDDGSTDDSATVAGRYPRVRTIRQSQQGLGAARNRGLRESRGEYLIFLDADDRLLPGALAHGRRWLEAYPGRAFVAGHFRVIDEDGEPTLEPPQSRLREDAYLQFLRTNHVRMHGAVMFRRAALESVGGYDPALRACEDYDLYLRIARSWPVAQHPELVAEYRRHASNMSRDPARMLRTTLEVLARQRPHVTGNTAARAALRQGRWAFRWHYASQALSDTRELVARGRWRPALAGLARLVRAGGWPIVPMLFREDGTGVLPKRWTDSRLGRRWRRWRHRREPPAPGQVRFGDLRRVWPMDNCFGYYRGLPVDRHYIEGFLARNAPDVRGRVLEVGDDAYTRRFGGDRVERVDILHVDSSNPRATLIADLGDADHLPGAAFDCVICTQTLQLVYDVRAALVALHRILAPGGVLLLTVPGISQTSDPTFHDRWYWAFTPASVERLLGDAFPGATIEVVGHGNVLAATAFLYGLATEELRPDELAAFDDSYPLLITARAAKPSAWRQE